MKKLLLLLIAVTAFGCSGDDSTQNVSVDDLMGEWIVTKQQSYMGDMYVYGDCNESPTRKRFVFYDNGTFTIQSVCENDPHNYSYTGTYTYEGDELHIVSQSPMPDDNIAPQATNFTGKYDVEYLGSNRISTTKTWDVENLGIGLYTEFEKQ